MSYPPPQPQPTDAAVARLSAQIEGIGREIGQMRRATEERLDRIEAQTVRTNGRVDALELEAARDEGAAEALDKSAGRALKRIQVWVAGFSVLVALGLGALSLILTHG